MTALDATEIAYLQALAVTAPRPTAEQAKFLVGRFMAAPRTCERRPRTGRPVATLDSTPARTGGRHAAV